jgi:1-phosphofructokinase
MQCLSHKGVRFAVDASKDVLLNTLKYKPFLIKPNVDELRETLNTEIKNDNQIIDAAKYLQTRGAQNVLVSRGEKGAILLDSKGFVHNAPAHDVKPIDTVGAGDSMVAGFLAGVDRNLGFDYALRLGLAAGGATAASENLASKKEILNLFKF